MVLGGDVEGESLPRPYKEIDGMRDPISEYKKQASSPRGDRQDGFSCVLSRWVSLALSLRGVWTGTTCRVPHELVDYWHSHSSFCATPPLVSLRGVLTGTRWQSR